MTPIVTKRCLAALVPAIAALACLVVAPAAAEANIEGGHPEFYNNNVRMGVREQPTSTLEWGGIHIESAQLGSEGIECSVQAMGSSWNEGSPPRGYGEILTWSEAGHVPTGTHNELEASCRPHGEASTPATFVTDEENFKAEQPLEPKDRKLTTPWNIELTCGVREEEFSAIVRIGVPNGAFPGASTPCPAEATEEAEVAEVASYKAERESKKGCYATNPSPEGCMKITIIEPGAGLEWAYGGTLHARLENGVKNGLSPSRWLLNTASGELQCEAPAGCVATFTQTGTIKSNGYNGQELLTAR